SHCMMGGVLILCSVSCNKVHQAPKDMIVNEGKQVELICSHKLTSYDRMHWYQQHGSELKYLGNLFYDTGYMEVDRISFSGDGRSEGTLKVSDVTLPDSAVYYCAVILLMPNVEYLSCT
uniref:Ig-like domain-containing protein n=1 Tax=Denticeps clupeoides TaxID=299321 RepID=A0AAY4AIY3_9TELE